MNLHLRISHFNSLFEWVVFKISTQMRVQKLNFRIGPNTMSWYLFFEKEYTVVIVVEHKTKELKLKMKQPPIQTSVKRNVTQSSTVPKRASYCTCKCLLLPLKLTFSIESSDVLKVNTKGFSHVFIKVVCTHYKNY